MDRRPRTPLRLLAPAALVAFAIALVVVLSSSGVDSRKSDGAPASGSSSSKTTSTTGGAGRTAKRRVYTVKAGDSLGAIAQKTGVPATTLQELNPQLDPQNLSIGQKIKLRQ